MFDDGQQGDLEPGDGIYGAAIPAPRVWVAGQMIRYYVTASDSQGNDSRAPAFLDREGRNQSPEYFGTIVTTVDPPSELPVLQWFAENPGSGRTRAGTRASVYYDGQFYDNIFVRQRGGATNGSSQKFQFNSGDKFYANEELGKVFEFNLNAQGSDPSYIRQTLAFESYSMIGAPSEVSFLTHVRVNGGFDRVGVFIEQVDEDFLDRNGLDDDGTIYKFVQRGNLDPVFADTITGIEKKTGDETDLSDLAEVVAGLNLDTVEERRQYMFDNFNIPQILNYLAVRSVTQDADDVRKNFYMYRDTEGTGEWMIIPWDKDWTFGITGDGGPDLSHPFFADRAHWKPNANQWNMLYEAMFNDPVTQQMYLRRLRSVMDEILQPPGTPAAERIFENRIDEIFATAAADLPSAAANSLNGLKNYFQTRRTQLYVTHSIDALTGANGVPVNSDAAGIPHEQVGNPTLEFGQIEFQPASGNQDEEFIELINSNDTAVDISGWLLRGGVEHEFASGTVIPAGASLFVSPKPSVFRARMEGPSGGQSLLVQGNYKGHISNFGELIELVGAGEELVASVTTPVAPSESQQYVRITEVHYNPAAPNADEITAGFADNDAFEFIELVNQSDTPVDLSLAQFTDGIEFRFDPGTIVEAGERFVVVGDLTAFRLRYGGNINVAGQFDFGRLDNDGEKLKLEDAAGGTIAEFSYNDSEEWPVAADGTGNSLVVVDTDGDYNLPANWRASNTIGGTPGVAEEPSNQDISDVRVSGTDWDAAFLDRLAQDGLDSLLTADAATVLPWAGIDQVSVTYGPNINVIPLLVPLSGIAGIDYTDGAETEQVGDTVTWTLATPIAIDRLTVTLSPLAADLAFGVLPGDVTGDGQVDIRDLSAIRGSLLMSADDEAYLVRADLNADGIVNLRDVQLLRGSMLDKLLDELPDNGRLAQEADWDARVDQVFADEE